MINNGTNPDITYGEIAINSLRDGITAAFIDGVIGPLIPVSSPINKSQAAYSSAIEQSIINPVIIGNGIAANFTSGIPLDIYYGCMYND